MNGGLIWSDSTHYNTTGYTLTANYDILIAYSDNGNGTKGIGYSGGGTVFAPKPYPTDERHYFYIAVVNATKGSRVYGDNDYYSCNVYGYNAALK